MEDIKYSYKDSTVYTIRHIPGSPKHQPGPYIMKIDGNSLSIKSKTTNIPYYNVDRQLFGWNRLSVAPFGNPYNPVANAPRKTVMETYYENSIKQDEKPITLKQLQKLRKQQKGYYEINAKKRI